MNLLVNTNVGSTIVHMYSNDYIRTELSNLIWGAFSFVKHLIAGEHSRVEKVKPDPLNLLVHTDVGSK